MLRIGNLHGGFTTDLARVYDELFLHVQYGQYEIFTLTKMPNISFLEATEEENRIV